MLTTSARALRRSGEVALAVVGAAWVVTLARILRHRVFASHDTLISYAHVWYISRRLWHAHTVPFRMPVLGHGQAFAFPYGLVPWLTAAIARPLAGDWIVTLWLVLGVLGVAATTFVAFPEVRRGWWAVMVLVDTALFSAPVSGQLVFLWAAAMLLGAIACWRRGHRRWAVVLAALAQITHPAVVAPITFGVVLCRLRWEEDRRRLLLAYAIATVPAIPFGLIVLASPVSADTSTATKLVELVITIAPRCLIVVVPVVAAVLVRRHATEVIAAALSVLLVAGTVVTWHVQDLTWAWGQIGRYPDAVMTDFTRSAAFEPGRTYRVMQSRDGKVEMYEALKGGAKLDGEFFPESLLRHGFANAVVYSSALRQRNVDVVVIFDRYTRNVHTNERALLDEIAGSTHACDGPLVCVRLKERTSLFRVYDVTRS